MLKKNQFIRSHGLGNDYLIVDLAQLSFPLTPQNIIQICNRHTGIGSDGILALLPASSAEAALKIYNPDGSEAEKSGNGLRIFSKFLYEHGYTEKMKFEIETLGGTVKSFLHIVLGHVVTVTVEMGQATFDAEKIPIHGITGEVINFPLEITLAGEKKRIPITGVSMGNPHCVVFHDQIPNWSIHDLGPLLENHPQFPNRSNVQLVTVNNPREVSIEIWERGAGYTMASGSSSCAVAAACVKTKKCQSDLTVHMPGGDLFLQVANDFQIKMRGPVEEICSGQFSDELLDHLKP
jgi:diaminopimelate epimerase